MDAVIHDGAPNVGGAWASEAYSQSWLVLESLKLACEFLAPRGTFVTKIFRYVRDTCTRWTLALNGPVAWVVCFIVMGERGGWGFVGGR